MKRTHKVFLRNPGKNGRCLVALGIALLLLIFAMSAVAQSVIRVSRRGSAAPDGSQDNPYQLVEAGACAANPGDVVLIEAGSYNELITLGRDFGRGITLRASRGNVVIGQTKGKPHVALKILTYNTHLFGDEALGLPPTFADEARARLIADRIRQENADIVGLQEVWDEELAAVIMDRAADVYPFQFYSNEHDEWDDLLNSGLLLLSKYPIINSTLTFYETESSCFPPWDCDAFASKGFVNATIGKGSFIIRVFLTHTDASSREARREQLRQLASKISEERGRDPSIPVVVLGDLNEDGEMPEQLGAVVSILGLRDAFRNAPCYDDKFKFTHHSENDLARIFDDSPSNSRLDYVLYALGDPLDVLPISAEVRQYRVSPPITEGGKASRDLSDHYGVVVEFSIFRERP